MSDKKELASKTLEKSREVARRHGLTLVGDYAIDVIVSIEYLQSEIDRLKDQLSRSG